MIIEMQQQDLTKIFSDNLSSRRSELQLTMATVAARAGISVPYISQMENGKRVPDVMVLARLAAALNTTAAALLTPGMFGAETNSA